MLARVLTVLLGLFLTTLPAQAEPLSLPLLAHCESEPGDLISKIQNEWGEVPLARGNGIIQSLSGGWMQSEFFIMVNPQEYTVSIIAIDPESGVECLLMVGDKFRPVAMGDPL